jgi:hypothetical protein
MSLNRWKVLACTLTVGVGGLAVFAQPTSWDKADPPKEPAPLPKLTAKPESPANGSDTPDPVKPVKGEVFDLDIPIPPAPVKADEPTKKPAVDPVFEPVVPRVPAPLILPVSSDDLPKPVAKPEDKKTIVIPPIPDVPPISPKPEFREPPKPLPVPELPKPSATKLPEVNLIPQPLIVPYRPSPSTVVPEPARPSTPLIAPTQPAEPTAKLKLLLRMGDGQPRFEIRGTTSTDLLLKVYGERIDMQAPPDQKSSSLAGVSAAGRVRFTAPGIEGSCDQLTILSGSGEVLLKGNIHLKSKNGKGWSERTAEKMVYQIGTSGMAKPTGTRPTVTPAGYIPD